MVSMLFGSNPIPMRNSPMQQLGELAAMIRTSGNPDKVVQLLMRKNPQFASFVQANRGKPPQQIARENGIDWGIIQQMMR